MRARGPAGAALLLSWLLPAAAGAQSVSAWTFTTATDGSWVRTQDAYVPSRVLLKSAGLRSRATPNITSHRAS